MTRVVLDAAAEEQFRNLSDRAKVCDRNGHPLGLFLPLKANITSAEKKRTPLVAEVARLRASKALEVWRLRLPVSFFLAEVIETFPLSR